MGDENREENDAAILNAIKYDRNQRKEIKFKVEWNIYVNRSQIDIEDYYITNNKGLIAWIKLDPCMVGEIHRRAAKASLKDFKTCTFILKIARDCKARVDSLLMEYKKHNKDFRYLIRNGEDDIRILIKHFSEGSYLPYRSLAIEVLGAISSIKAKTIDPEEESPGTSGQEKDEQGFQKVTPSKSACPNYIPKDQIFTNITAILNGFELQSGERRN